MKRKNYSIPVSALKGTFFYDKKCMLKPSQTFRLTWSGKIREYLFSAPLSILNLEEKDTCLFFTYWEKRLKKQMIDSEFRKNIRALFHNLRSPRSLESIKNRYFSSPSGLYHDLESHFEKVLQNFIPDFENTIHLWWSRKPLRSYWGKYISDGPVIVVNRLLDSPQYPEYLIEYILYHELVHHLIEPDFEEANYRHSSSFRAFMKKFPREADIRRELKLMAKSHSRIKAGQLL